MTRTVENNRVNLCDSCMDSYPECNSEVLFGDGIGNDNICCCNRYRTSDVKIKKKDLGDLCIFALRYCMGRMSYAPDMCRKIVRPLLPKLTDDSVKKMIEDCKYQASTNQWGDENIDKPGWIKWRQELEDEKKRRECLIWSTEF